MNLYDLSQPPRFCCRRKGCYVPMREMGLFCSKECRRIWERENMPQCEVVGCEEAGRPMTVLGRNGFLCQTHSELGHYSPEA